MTRAAVGRAGWYDFVRQVLDVRKIVVEREIVAEFDDALGRGRKKEVALVEREAASPVEYE